MKRSVLSNMNYFSLSLLLCLTVLVSGCTEPREGLGGGKDAKVHVTILTDAVEEGAGNDATSETVAAAKITKFGTFRGKITVDGTVSELSPLVAKGKAMKDAVCSMNAVPNEAVIVGDGGGLKNVFVYLKRIPNVDVPPPPTDPIVIDQVGCKFIPHAAICRVGQPIKLLNSDPVGHNVKITSNSLTFNQILGQNDSATVQYDRAEKFPLAAACDIHAWMLVYQLPIDHPWVALTDENGEFVIENCPAGEMEFVVWHEVPGYVERSVKVNVPASGEVVQNITVSASKLAK